MVSKETYYSVKRDLLQCQKRPTTVSKETYYSIKRDLLYIGAARALMAANQLRKLRMKSGKKGAAGAAGAPGATIANNFFLCV
jgi:hypothetical protein